jgi:hypothetical protein
MRMWRVGTQGEKVETRLFSTWSRRGKREDWRAGRRTHPGVMVGHDIGMLDNLEKMDLAEDSQPGEYERSGVSPAKTSEDANTHSDGDESPTATRPRRSASHTNHLPRNLPFLHAYNPSASPFKTCRTRWTVPAPPLPKG